MLKPYKLYKEMRIWQVMKIAFKKQIETFRKRKDVLPSKDPSCQDPWSFDIYSSVPKREAYIQVG